MEGATLAANKSAFENRTTKDNEQNKLQENQTTAISKRRIK
jgi:hypothetical protein